MRSVPNILSIFRICLVPLLIIVYFSEQRDAKVYAAGVYAVASVSDFLDGFIARKYNAESNLGKVLDPLGDKLMVISVMACITIDGLIPVWAVMVAFFKELLMAVGGLVVHKKFGTPIPSSNIVGKTSTVVFFLVCVTLMLFKSIPNNAAIAMISVALGLMLVALGTYINTFLAVMRNRVK